MGLVLQKSVVKLKKLFHSCMYSVAIVVVQLKCLTQAFVKLNFRPARKVDRGHFERTEGQQTHLPQGRRLVSIL